MLNNTMDWLISASVSVETGLAQLQAQREGQPAMPAGLAEQTAYDDGEVPPGFDAQSWAFRAAELAQRSMAADLAAGSSP
ncbi:MULTISPECIES: hypothetical protein [Arthrobacter]|uniref:Uncharacterized protein n=2 Tax=Arthrobacter TaxID=1663 RepID=A0ABU9KK12_9MICC|nr:hypothetical protein [Arthrobacter sp. YJM1]MDP5227165.1 hypothetical protein [Arthrobacter sp. YJM1]